MHQTARRPALPVALAALVLTAGLAGCLAQAPAAEERADPAAALPGVHDDAPPETPGAIRGVVTDAAHVPIAGATVTLLGENESEVTGADGRFEFRGLADGRYLVVAEAEGHETQTKEASAKNGTAFELAFRLPALPRATPHEEHVELAGFLACYAAARNGHEHTAYNCGHLDPNQANSFEVAVREGVHGLVVEVQWEANLPTTRNLLAVVETVGYGDDDALLAEASGPSPLRLQVGRAALEKYYPGGGDVRVTVLPAASLGDEEAGVDAGFALQQSFTSVITAFYHQPAPPGYSVFEGQ